MTTTQILSMIREEKTAYRTAKQLRKQGDEHAARIEEDHACDLTCQIDRRDWLRKSE